MPLLLPNDGTSERQYLDLVREVLASDINKMDRTGKGTRVIHGATMRFDLSDGTIPLLTTKFVSWKSVIKELIWFLNGDTNIRWLLQNKVTIWSEWPHAAYVKATGDAIDVKTFERRVLTDDAFAEKWGSIGPGYGKQWRAWQADGKTYDQISDVLARIQRDPDSRRLIFHGWNVAELDQMLLPPCHLLYQFFVAHGKLSCTLYQRSCDLGLGVPFNIASCAVLVRLFAQQTGLEPGSIFWVGHDVHLYKDHLTKIETVQLPREPYAFPHLVIQRKPATLFDYTIDDFDLPDYRHHPKIDLPVAV